MNRRTSWVFVGFIFFQLFFTGCSSLQFKSGGKTAFKISADHNSEKLHEVLGTADFYFWGISPGSFTVDLDDYANRLGLERPGYVSVEEFISVKSMFFTLLTLGLYSPLDYKISVYAKKGDVH